METNNTSPDREKTASDNKRYRNFFCKKRENKMMSSFVDKFAIIEPKNVNRL